MRKKGALNRPKYIQVTLGELTRRFTPDTPIKISAEYASFFGVDLSAAPRVPTVAVGVPAASPTVAVAAPAPAPEPEPEKVELMPCNLDEF